MFVYPKNIFALCVTIGLITQGIYAGEKMRLGLSDEIATSVKLPDFVTGTLRSKVREHLVNSKKFDVISRSSKDMKKLFEEIKFASSRIGRVNEDDKKKAEYGKIAGIEYAIFIEVNDWFVGNESSKFKNINAPSRQLVRIGASLRIVHTSTARLKAEKSVTCKQYKAIRGGNYGGHSAPDRELANKVLDALALNICSMIMDELYPIKVVEKMGKQLFLNRGKAHGIKKGLLYEICALKKTKDEDTGEMLELEFPVGKAKVVSVAAKTSRAMILEDFGINKGCVAKLVEPTADAKKASHTKKKAKTEIREKEW